MGKKTGISLHGHTREMRGAELCFPSVLDPIPVQGLLRVGTGITNAKNLPVYFNFTVSTNISRIWHACTKQKKFVERT